MRLLIGLIDNAAYLAVDFDCRVLGIILLMCDVASEENLLLVAAESRQGNLLAHAPFADHLMPKLGRLLDIVARTGPHMTDHRHFADPPTHHLAAPRIHLI